MNLPYETQQIQLQPEQCEVFFRETGYMEMHYSKLYAGLSGHRHLLWDLCRNPQLVLSSALDFLHVPATSSYQVDIKKQRHNPVSELVENYEDLKSYFADTCWRHYFMEADAS